MTDSTATANNATIAGGAVYNAGKLWTTRSTISENVAVEGAGVYNIDSVWARGSVFANNEATSGAAIYSYDGSLLAETTTFRGNTATSGAGVYVRRGSADFDRATFRENNASSNGGALYNHSAALDVLNSTFAGNFAGANGGAIYNAATLTASNVAASGNYAAGKGGGVYSVGNDSDFVVVNSLILGNGAPTGGDFYRAGGSAVAYYSFFNQVAPQEGGVPQTAFDETVASQFGDVAYDVYVDVVRYRFQVGDESVVVLGGAVNSDGVIPISPNGLAVDAGTLVGTLGRDTYWLDKISGAWRKLGEDVPSVYVFDASAIDYGLTNGLVCTVGQNNLSRIDAAVERKFAVGPYVHGSPVVADVYFKENSPGYASTISIATNPPKCRSSIRVQWYRVDSDEVATPIEGATNLYYKVGADDIGYRIRAIARGVDSYSGSVAVTTDEVVKTPELTVVRLSTNGPAYGTTLKATVVPSYIAADATFQWYRVDADGVATPIEGATNIYYKVGSDDFGYKIRVVATAGGFCVGSSEATTLYAARQAPMKSVSLSAAEPIVGVTISMIRDPGAATCSYQWYRVDPTSGKMTRIEGATNIWYKPTSADVGYFLRGYAAGVGNYSGSKAVTSTKVVAFASVSNSALDAFFAESFDDAFDEDEFWTF
ncbi:MAG: hypothetical protein HUK22_03160 [Thermoguttaceae bacterium]|nr:hypothetical protein [Thermoguttaceae bacterium]